MEISTNNQRRVVITGMGLVTPLGQDLDTFWQNILAGKSGISPIENFDVSAYDCKIAGEIKTFDSTPFFKVPKDVRRCDRYTRFAMVAAKKAVADSGLDLAVENGERIGVLVGSGIGGMQTLEEQYANLLHPGPNSHAALCPDSPWFQSSRTSVETVQRAR